MVAPTTPKKRCAIYTRKSHEEGLDQDFNSLDAQRESGETFIASQKHEGWVALPTRYDDGGFTGANTDRPALARLMADIDAGKIDAVVVYKIDRLSRSLIDFVGLLQVFEQRNVAFVSVTQQFNTASPMGRLILNILICFAQFERENIAERIRDKMAASRRRGMWVGGVPPLGYDIDYAAKKLVVNVAEAATIRWIFTRFTHLRSGCAVADEARAKGLRTKAWTSKSGKVHPGQPMDRGHIYRVLSLRCYLGEVEYRGQFYRGEHSGIIDRELWDRVQNLLAENHHARGNRARATVPGFLKGVARCGHCGSALTMSWSRGSNRQLYRYYRCVVAEKQGHDACPLSAVPAGDLEVAVLKELRRVFLTPEIIAATSSAMKRAYVEANLNLDHRAVLEAMGQLDAVWNELFPAEQERVVDLLVERIVVSLDTSTLHLRIVGLAGVAAELRGLTDVVVKDADGIAEVRLPIHARRRCGRTRLLLPAVQRSVVEQDAPDALVQAIARAFRWQEQIEVDSRSITGIAKD
nr:recombinase family protein [Acidobacteriota bacterium]